MNKKQEIIQVISKHNTVKIADPLGPIFLPNNPAVIELNRGKNTKSK